jgi:hypothetical protein
MLSVPGNQTTAAAAVPQEDPMTLDDLHEGMRVLYIPHHAHGERTHPDCQRGIVTSKSATQAFVRYGSDHHSHATAPEVLVPDDHATPWCWRYTPPPDSNDR